MKELVNILSADLLRSLVNSKRLQIKQLNSLIALLIKANIQFTFTFEPASSVREVKAILTIYLRPNVSVTITFDFDSCGMLLD